MKPHIIFGLLLVTACPFARSQVAPAATAGRADLRYALRYAENVDYTDTFGTWHTINTSGSINYTNGRTNHLFSLDYTGGYTSTLSGPPYSQGAFQVLSITQGLNRRKWMLDFSDEAGYRPQAPTTGFSGIPGIGEPIGSGLTSSQLILTVNTHALENQASAQIQHIVSPELILNGNATHDLLHYPDGNGIDTDELMIGAGPTLRSGARNSFTGQYAFSRFSYSDYDFRLETHTLTGGYQRTWNRSFRSNIAVGPEWIRASALLSGSTDISAQASLDFQSQRWSSGVEYARGTSGGSGYLLGAAGDSVTANLSRSFGRSLTLQTTGSYHHISPFAKQGAMAAEYGGIQVSWRMGRYLNAFGNYTAASQSTSAQVPSNVLNQLMHSVSFGMSYSRELKAAK